MFDFLSKEKQRLAKSKQNLVVVQKYSHMQIEQAKSQSKVFLSSPVGISAAFAAGALKGATADIPTPPASLVFTLASEFF